MTARQQRRHANCLDCGAPVDGNFCSNCGQENSDYRVSLKRLLGDLFEELFQLESRLWRSLYNLFRRPGQLTLDYNAGRRVRYTSPLRLYLIASVAYFFLGAVLPPTASDLKIDFGDAVHADGSIDAQATDDFGRALEARLGVKEGMTAAEVQRHTNASLNANAPRVMALLVPLFALMTMSLFRRPRRFFVEHLVLSLHVHAVAFCALIVGLLSRWEHGALVSLVPVAVWMTVALRVLFGQSWWLTIVKSAVIVLFYSVLVALGIIAALML